jgi:thiol-disulfide isomerase/thioredoxin
MKLLKILTLFFCVLVYQSKAQTVSILTLSDLESRMEKGKDTLYVVNFWATWCAPCVKEIPYFEKLGETYANKPMKVILVSLDFKSNLEKVVIPFVKEKKLESDLFLIENPNDHFINSVDKNWSGALPATLFVKKGKSIRAFYEQEFTWEELHDIYLKKSI